jgi:hypothetical protein
LKDDRGRVGEIVFPHCSLLSVGDLAEVTPYIAYYIGGVKAPETDEEKSNGCGRVAADGLGRDTEKEEESDVKSD